MAHSSCAGSSFSHSKRGTAKGAYLAQIAQDSELRQIADALFFDDYTFITSLPLEYKELQTQLIQLMQMAYRSGIRATDRRVKNM